MSESPDRDAGVHVAKPTKNLLGGPETEALRREIEPILERDVPRVVIDLGRVSHLNSPGLGVLVGLHARCARRGGWMRVARIGSRVRDLFLITKLTMVFDTYDTVEDAIAGVHGDRH